MKQLISPCGKTILVDDDCFDYLNQWQWSLNPNGYARRTIRTSSGGASLKLHRVIMNTPKDLVVDHINGNPLDNRKCNLRICTRSQNQMNRTKVATHNKSGTTGVCWIKSRSKWKVQISIEGKNKHIGYFDDLDKAILIRKDAELKYYGVFAPTL